LRAVSRSFSRDSSRRANAAAAFPSAPVLSPLFRNAHQPRAKLFCQVAAFRAPHFVHFRNRVGQHGLQYLASASCSSSESGSAVSQPADHARAIAITKQDRARFRACLLPQIIRGAQIGLQQFAIYVPGAASPGSTLM